LTPISTKSFVGWGFAPDPTGGAYSAPLDPLVVFRGPTSKERGEEGRERVRPLPYEEKRKVPAYVGCVVTEQINILLSILSAYQYNTE